MKKLTLALTAITALALVLVLGTTDAAARKPIQRSSLNLATSPALGSEEALVTIILFYNFRCSYGNYVFDAFQTIGREFPGTFRLYFKHHAINRYNSKALVAAQAAMAAHAQGKFWDLAEILFRNRYKLSTKHLETYIQEIGMKVKPYKKAMSRAIYKSRVQREVAQSKKFLGGTTSCPVVWINGKRMSGYVSAWRLKRMLRTAAREVRGIRIRPLL